MADTIAAMKRAFAALSTEQAEMPQRLALAATDATGTTLFKPASQPGALGAKIVSVFPNNPARGRPLIYGLVILLDPATGEPSALLDGTFLTAWRTGAASGAATDLLARSEARQAAIFGCGAQARTQVLAIDAVRNLETIRIFAPRQERVEAFIEELAPKVKARLEVASNSRDAVQDADILCAATTSSKPVWNGRDLKPGCHINGVGSYTHEMRELDGETVRRSRVFVDQRQAAQTEAGDLIQAAQESLTSSADWTELGEVVVGSAKGRVDEDEITFFKSVGVAVQDVEAGALALSRARETGIGRWVEL